ncbi:ABC transporter ATP-binding protein [Bacillus suaedae]|uniref:ABC transporter ATP-binding protein n=1 Tax=Halalkalibacter suaedae TaxID=2822140 RepID=A0A940WVD7_9BACI|nr:ABC transporter ATP-binding protein [Bacillus suaedae]MBP3952433.1 ABC transporter ATP-binding protein [Bacillus suaedae]
MSNQFTKPFRYKRIPITNHERKGKNKKVENWVGTLTRVWSYLSAHRGYLSLVVLMVIISSVLSLLGPFLIGVAIDDYLVAFDQNGLIRLLFMLAIIYVLYSLSMWLQSFWMIGIAQQTVFSLRKELFEQIQLLPIPYFDKRQHGELMSKMTNDIENVSNTLNSSVIQILSSVLTFFGILIVMLYLSPLMTLITLTVVPLMVLGMKWITRRTSVFFKEQQRELGEVNGFIEETISGQRVVKAFSQEEQVITQFMDKSEKLKRASFWAQAYSGFIPKLMNVLNNLSFAVIAGIGGWLALGEQSPVTIGMIVIFAEYSRQFTRPLNDLANQFNTLLSAVAGAERVFEVLDEKKEEDQEGSINLETVKGNVEFKNVSFSYEKESKTISNANFSVKAGEMIALVGPTGAGKTTIINMLSRFYSPKSGEITIDGINILTIKRENLRKHMGFVLQDSFLFEASIMENIRYGSFDASDDEVREAAKQANAFSFISKLPNGFETILDQEGSGISQGQRQLLSIARVILANPSILILDEATSSIDTITEIKIQEALQRLMIGRTSFVIAHRLNTIQQANQILVLNEGEIVENGSHTELLRKGGLYAEMNHQGQKDD